MSPPYYGTYCSKGVTDTLPHHVRPDLVTLTAGITLKERVPCSFRIVFILYENCSIVLITISVLKFDKILFINVSFFGTHGV